MSEDSEATVALDRLEGRRADVPPDLLERRAPPPLPHVVHRRHGVHVVGASSLAAGHLTLIPELREALGKQGREDIAIVAGGVIPPDDFDAVRAAGAAEIFPPGTVIPEAAERLLDSLLERT